MTIAAQPRRPRYAMPAFMEQALIDFGLMEAYRGRPPYQQNDYVWWVSSPKRQETQARRLAQMLDELSEGRRYMNMAWTPPEDRMPWRRDAAERRGRAATTGPLP